MLFGICSSWRAVFHSLLRSSTMYYRWASDLNVKKELTLFTQGQFFLFLFVFFDFFECYSEHQFNAVQLINFTRS